MFINESGECYVCGSNESGQLGLGTTEKEVLPTRLNIREKISEVAGGNSHSLILISSGEVYSSGSNN